MKWLLMLWYVGGIAIGDAYKSTDECIVAAAKVKLMTYEKALGRRQLLMTDDEPVAAYCVPGFLAEETPAP